MFLWNLFEILFITYFFIRYNFIKIINWNHVKHLAFQRSYCIWKKLRSPPRKKYAELQRNNRRSQESYSGGWVFYPHTAVRILESFLREKGWLSKLTTDPRTSHPPHGLYMSTCSFLLNKHIKLNFILFLNQNLYLIFIITPKVFCSSPIPYCFISIEFSSQKCAFIKKPPMWIARWRFWKNYTNIGRSNMRETFGR